MFALLTSEKLLNIRIKGLMGYYFEVFNILLTSDVKKKD